MSHPVLLLLLAGFISIALVVWRQRVFRWSWAAGSLYIFGIAMLLNLPDFFADVGHGRSIVVSTGYEAVISYTPLFDAFRRLCVLALAISSLFWVSLSIRARREPVGYILLIALLPLLSLATAQSFDQRAAVLAIVLLSCAWPSHYSDICCGVTAYFLVVVIGSGFAGGLFSSQAFVACVASSKCGVDSTLFAGLFNSGNGLGLTLAAALPFALTQLRGFVGLAVVGLAGYEIYLAGSRTGQIAFGMTIVVWMLLGAFRRKQSKIINSSRVSYLFAAGALLIGVALPVVSTDPTDYTGRVALWHLAWEQLRVSIVWGRGFGAWQANYAAGLIPENATYSVHNEWLELIYVDGILGVFIFLLWALVLVWRSRYLALVAFLAVPSLVECWFERPWSVTSIDWLSWVLPALLLISGHGPPQVPSIELEPELERPRERTSL